MPRAQKNGCDRIICRKGTCYKLSCFFFAFAPWTFCFFSIAFVALASLWCPWLFPSGKLQHTFSKTKGVKCSGINNRGEPCGCYALSGHIASGTVQFAKDQLAMETPIEQEL